MICKKQHGKRRRIWTVPHFRDMDVPVTLNLSNWMADLPHGVLDKSLIELAIPGTHNSFSYKLDPTSDIGPDVPNTVRRLGPLAKGFMYKWSVTQNQTFSEQLESGIRYFDFRIAVKSGSSDFFFVHGLFGDNVKNGLMEIKVYLDAHAKEIVIIDFNHLYNMTTKHHQTLIEIVCEVFGPKLCLFVGVDNLTLNTMWENDLQVVVLYHHEIAEENPLLWPGHCIQAPWANTPNAPKLIQHLDTNYLQHRGLQFHVCQGVLTVDTGFILGHLSGSLRSDLAGKAMSLLLDWLKDKKPGSRGVNICTADFTDIYDNEFTKRVIMLNHLE